MVRFYAPTTDQIEIAVQSLVSEPLLVRFWSVASRVSVNHYFGYCGSKNIFAPKRSGSMYGEWNFDVCRLLGGRVKEVESQRIFLDGVGYLFFTIGQDLRLRLQQQLWLKVASNSFTTIPVLSKQVLENVETMKFT